MRNRATTPLKKAKVRQSWSKYNLYNLSRIKPPQYRTKNFFQEKWSAKSSLRQYHGEQVREGQWTRMFSRRFRAVVPMDPKYLASNDGRLESAGRGAGLKVSSGEKVDRFKLQDQRIPYMAMTFAPLERRLDTSIFRALFASSTRQARQFVVHGAVRVNGKKMIYPGYLLNPGDMFQIEPDRVLFATGKRKGTGTSTTRKSDSEKNDTALATQAADGDNEADQSAEAGKGSADTDAESEEDPRETLKLLLSQAKELIGSAPGKVPGKQKQSVRAFQKAVKRTLSRSKTSTILTDSLEAQFLELRNILRVPEELPETRNAEAKDQEEQVSEAEKDPNAPSKTTTTTTSSPSPSASSNSSSVIDIKSLTNSDILALRDAMALLRDNPIDSSKPYATPWSPRDYMSAFAFIPRYLEVNQNICAAVYLRHPVARPGLAEVPSPYSEKTQGEAFAWYLRRR